MQREQLAKAAIQVRLQVAIDGPAGAGKSTLGEALASALGCHFLDTGLLYRAVTARALKQGISPNDAVGLAALTKSMRFEFNNDERGLLVDGVCPGPDLRSQQVEDDVSVISAHQPLRESLLKVQRDLASAGGIVMAGRDIGTVVLPDAQVKLWVTASQEERERRRLEQIRNDRNSRHERRTAQVNHRDRLDAGRSISPLKKAPDAESIDTGELGPVEALNRSLDIVRARIGDATRTHGMEI